MKAKALKLFGDGKRLIKEGEIFDVSEEMFEKINSTKNGILAEMVDDSDNDETNLQHLGGGYYQLSNGDKVKGKEAALKAQAELDAANDDDLDKEEPEKEDVAADAINDSPDAEE